MTAPPASDRLAPLDPGDAPLLAELLTVDFGRRPRDGATANQYLLDALDRGEHERFFTWPVGARPAAVLYASPTGAVVPAGDPAAGPALAEGAEQVGWRILIGDAAVCSAVLDAYPRGLFRRRPSAREQRFMVVTAGDARPQPSEPAGFRRGGLGDLEAVTEFACRLHVEDEMGPPISRAGRVAVRGRMLDSLARGATWVVESDDGIVAKLDLSLRSRRRGAQIAGVYVVERARGRGVAQGMVAGLARRLLDEGLPSVTLHVRAGNVAAIRAYERAGLVDAGAWLLAFR